MCTCLLILQHSVQLLAVSIAAFFCCRGIKEETTKPEYHISIFSKTFSPHNAFLLTTTIFYLDFHKLSYFDIALFCCVVLLHAHNSVLHVNQHVAEVSRLFSSSLRLQTHQSFPKRRQVLILIFILSKSSVLFLYSFILLNSLILWTQRERNDLLLSKVSTPFMWSSTGLILPRSPLRGRKQIWH